ncbi:MAG: ATPase [Defluviitaleaceae bacterium]|nr:ATPase [Defluviitaleaceae bacterium]
MDALLDYLDDIEEVLDSSKSLPFTNKISVEKDRILEILSEIRLNLPDDIRSAQRILGDHDRIVAEATRKAQDIEEAAENEAKIKTNNHEIFRRASDQASEVIENAKQDARDLRLNARDYADEILQGAETQIKEYMTNLEQQHKRVMEYYAQMIDVIYENRQQLRGR